MKVVVDKNYEQLSAEISRLPDRIESGEGETIYDSRNRVSRFLIAGHDILVKRFKRVNFVQQVVYSFFRPSKARRAYLFAEEFIRRGIETPARIAYMERRRLGLFSVGYFVSRRVEGTETSLLLREVQDYPKDLADAVVSHIVLMHSRGILHGDLNLSNFLCRTEHGEYRFSMIDTNRSRFTDGWPSNEQCLQNLVRLTHRRDLYEYLLRCYARQRGWDEASTVAKALTLLDRFENRKFRL